MLLHFSNRNILLTLEVFRTIFRSYQFQALTSTLLKTLQGMSATHGCIVSFRNFHLFFRQVNSQSERSQCFEFRQTSCRVWHTLGILLLVRYCWCLNRSLLMKIIGRCIISRFRVHFKELRKWLFLSSPISRDMLFSIRC